MINHLNYRFEEAEDLQNKYSSWIGRDAHTGKGKKQALKSITITEGPLLRPAQDATLCQVEFIFDDGTVLSAYEFLLYNSLVSTDSRQETSNHQRGSVA